MRVDVVIKALPAYYTHRTTQHIHPSFTLIGSSPETSAPSALWDISRSIHPCVSPFLLLYLRVHLFILHLHLLRVVTAHEQHVFLHSSTCHTSQGDSPQRLSLSFSLPPSFSVNHRILVSFPLNRIPPVRLTFTTSLPSSSHPQTRSLPRATSAPIY